MTAQGAPKTGPDGTSTKYCTTCLGHLFASPFVYGTRFAPPLPPVFILMGDATHHKKQEGGATFCRSPGVRPKDSEP